eukprot:44490-Eustigmatos_ZCMA.PRE.1
MELTMDGEKYPARLGESVLWKSGISWTDASTVCTVMSSLQTSTAPSIKMALRCLLYIARASVNLPCVVEVQKTVDQVTLFKSGDVGQ